MQFHDRLKFTTTGTSAASLSDGTAVAGCRNIAKVISDTAGQTTALAVGAQGVPFTVEDGTGKWEDSLFTVGGTSAAPTLTRTQVLASSAGGTTAETFTGSTLTVFNTVPGKILSCVAIDSFPTAFSTIVPLTQIGTVHMPRYSVTGNLTFTAAANAVKGAYAEYPLILDGTSTLTFTGFTEHGSSSGLLNTSGIPNTVYFWYDGYNYWWSASQAAVPVAIDTTAPTATSAAVANATPSTVAITASEAVDSSFVPAASAFTVSGHTVLSVAISGSTINLSVSPAFTNGEAAQTVTYIQPGSNALRDLAGNLMGAFSALAITNNVQPNANAITMTGPTTGTAGVASSNFTVALSPVGSNLSGTNTITPSDGGAGGTFTPTSVGLTQGSPSATFTYTAASAGAKTISVTNSSGLTNPSPITYTASASDTTAPTFSSAQVANATPTQIVITMSEALANSVPATSAFSVSGGKTVSGVAVSGSTVTVTVTPAYAYGDTITVSYTQPGTNPRIQDASGNATASFGPSSVTNNINAPAADYPRLNPATLSSTVVESGTGPYIYTGTSGQTMSTEKGGLTSKSISASADGYLDFQILTLGDGGVEWGFRQVSTPGTYPNQIGVEAYTSGTGPVYYRAVGSAATTYVVASTDTIRIGKIGGLLKIQYKPSGASSFTDITSTSSYNAQQLWIDIAPWGTAQVQLLDWSGLA
jgi:hypothetical protein